MPKLPRPFVWALFGLRVYVAQGIYGCRRAFISSLVALQIGLRESLRSRACARRSGRPAERKARSAASWKKPGPSEARSSRSSLLAVRRRRVSRTVARSKAAVHTTRNQQPTFAAAASPVAREQSKTKKQSSAKQESSSPQIDAIHPPVLRHVKESTATHRRPAPPLLHAVRGRGPRRPLGLLRKLGAPDYPPEEYVKDKSQLNIVKSVHVEALPDDGVAEAAWVASLIEAGRAPTVKAIVGKVDLAAPDAAQKLDALVKTSDLVKGVRYIIDYDGPWGEDNGTHPEVSRHGKDYLRGPEASDFERGFALLAKHGLSYDPAWKSTSATPRRWRGRPGSVER